MLFSVENEERYPRVFIGQTSVHGVTSEANESFEEEIREVVRIGILARSSPGRSFADLDSSGIAGTRDACSRDVGVNLHKTGFHTWRPVSANKYNGLRDGRGSTAGSMSI